MNFTLIDIFATLLLAGVTKYCDKRHNAYYIAEFHRMSFYMNYVNVTYFFNSNLPGWKMDVSALNELWNIDRIIQ
jgi:hypothetical protein